MELNIRPHSNTVKYNNIMRFEACDSCEAQVHVLGSKIEFALHRIAGTKCGFEIQFLLQTERLFFKKF